MAQGVEHALVCQDAIGGDEIFEENRAGGTR